MYVRGWNNIFIGRENKEQKMVIIVDPGLQGCSLIFVQP